MTSLRARLILGSALVAIVPLAITMVLLSQRIESMVRTQAAERLNAALGGFQVQLKTDGERIARQLEILGRDPVLKRLYLLRPTGGRDLSDYLAERRFLLGLDFLEVADLSGTVVADGSEGLDVAPGLTMAARAPIRYENQNAGVVRGGLVFDSAFLARLKGASGVELVLNDGSGRPLAATLAGARPATLPLRNEVERIQLPGRSYLTRSFPLAFGAPREASITGLVSTASADQTIATLQLSLGLLGVLGLAIAVLLGVLWSSQISRPVEQLTAFSRRLAQGEWDEPLTLEGVRELQTLGAALDRMRLDLAAYRARLITSERQAAWSQMARKVAHEIRNPLTPIAVSVADLKRSFEQKRTDFPEILDQATRTIAAEIETLKHLLQEFAEFARLPAPRFAPCPLSQLFADLESLYGREAAEGRLIFSAPGEEITFSADAGQIRQALVNLIKNGLEALDGEGRVSVSAAREAAVLEIAVSDTGPGLSAEQKANLFVPGFTTKAFGSGLGLTIVERIVNDHGGTIAVDSGSASGTTFRIRLPLEQRT